MVITSQHDRYYNFHSSSCIQNTTLQIIQFPLLLLHPKHYITDSTISTPPASGTLHYRYYNFHSFFCIQNHLLWQGPVEWSCPFFLSDYFYFWVVHLCSSSLLKRLDISIISFMNSKNIHYKSESSIQLLNLCMRYLLSFYQIFYIHILNSFFCW